MTLQDLQTLYDTLVSNLGTVRVEYQGRMIEYSSGDARIKELQRLQSEIADLTRQASGSPGGRCTYGSFNRG